MWVETGQMHQRSDFPVDHNENLILDDNEVGAQESCSALNLSFQSALVHRGLTYN